MKLNHTTFHKAFWFLYFLFAWGATSALYAQYSPDDSTTWNPPLGRIDLSGIHYPSDGTLPHEMVTPNLCGRYFFRISHDQKKAYLEPVRGCIPIFNSRDFKDRKKLLQEWGDSPDHLLDVMGINGYGIDYVKIPRPHTNVIIPVLGCLYYIPANPEVSAGEVWGCALFRLDSSHPAYKKLNFKERKVYSFPINDLIAEWYANPDRDKKEFPQDTTHMLHAHKIIIREIEIRANKNGKSVPMAEIAIFPVLTKDPKESDFQWYSAGNELAIPQASVKSSKKPGKPFELDKIQDLQYYKIVNIVPRDSQTIKVPPVGGGPPIECKPIGWVDLDIHGRPEKEKVETKPNKPGGTKDFRAELKTSGAELKTSGIFFRE
ncbi:MAG: hypothetical protein PVH19_11050 [Planctomycetia bacterium]|jgi:hypothetical protein